MKIDMIQIFGHFDEKLPLCQEYLTLVFSPSSCPIKQRWKNNGLSADFLADYFATFFPGNNDPTTQIDRKAEVKNAVNYIANELLENAMKFHDDSLPYNISVALQLHHDRLVFLSTNSINPMSMAKFQLFIQYLTTSDPDELYIHQLETNAQDQTSTTSSLGYLTMLNDYLATLGWRFETIQKDPELITVTTMVQIKI